MRAINLQRPSTPRSVALRRSVLCLLDRTEIGAVGRQEEELVAGGFDLVADAHRWHRVV